MNTTTKPRTNNNAQSSERLLTKCQGHKQTYGVCGKNATSIEPDTSRRLGTERVVTKVGERSEFDILMGIDNREETAAYVPILGPTLPVGFCKTHSPKARAARQAEKDAASRAQYDRKHAVNRSWTRMADDLRAAVMPEGDEFKYEIAVSYDRDFQSNGVRLSSKAVKRILELLEGGEA